MYVPQNGTSEACVLREPKASPSWTLSAQRSSSKGSPGERSAPSLPPEASLPEVPGHARGVLTGPSSQSHARNPQTPVEAPRMQSACLQAPFLCLRRTLRTLSARAIAREPAGLPPAPREHSPTPMTLTADAEPTRSSPWPVLTWKVDEEGTAIPGDRSVKEEGGKGNRETARARDTLPVGSAHSVCKHGSTRPLSVR